MFRKWHWVIFDETKDKKAQVGGDPKTLSNRHHTKFPGRNLKQGDKQSFLVFWLNIFDHYAHQKYCHQMFVPAMHQ